MPQVIGHVHRDLLGVADVASVEGPRAHHRQRREHSLRIAKDRLVMAVETAGLARSEERPCGESQVSKIPGGVDALLQHLRHVVVAESTLEAVGVLEMTECRAIDRRDVAVRNHRHLFARMAGGAGQAGVRTMEFAGVVGIDREEMDAVGGDIKTAEAPKLVTKEAVVRIGREEEGRAEPNHNRRQAGGGDPVN